MKSIKITIFITTAIFFSMILASLKVHAGARTEMCDPNSKSLYYDIQLYKQTEKIFPEGAVIGESLQAALKRLRMVEFSTKQQVSALEDSFAKCYVSLSEDEELSIKVEAETLQKMLSPL